MKKIILMMILFLLSFSYGFGAIVRTSRIYLSQEPVRGIPSVDFAMVGIEIDNKIFEIEDENSYFEFSKGNIGNEIISMENIQIDSSENKVDKDKKRIYFKYRQGIGYFVKVNISGKLIFHWDKISKETWPQGLMDNNRIIKIGEIHKANGIFIEDREVFLVLPGMKISEPLNVKVDRHMNLGKGMAGELFKTNGGTTGGTPAIISLTGGEKEKVRIIIPKTTLIRNNSSGDTIKVKLDFKDKATDDIDRMVLDKRFENGNKIENIEINGEMQTNKSNIGKYTGTFKVRAEYID